MILKKFSVSEQPEGQRKKSYRFQFSTTSNHPSRYLKIRGVRKSKVESSSVSDLSLTLVKNELSENHLSLKNHKLIILRFWFWIKTWRYANYFLTLLNLTPKKGYRHWKSCGLRYCVLQKVLVTLSNDQVISNIMVIFIWW